jgi:hypothetical protein
MMYYGVAGKNNVGKSTVGAMLAEILPDALVVEMSSPIDDTLRTVLGYHVDKDRDYGDGMTGRNLFITIGQTFRRFDPDVWVKAVSRKINYVAVAWGRQPENIIISGIRFLNEMEGIVEQDGLMIWVDRDGSEGRQVGDVTEQMCDVVVHNSGTLDELREKIKDIIKI